MGEAIFIKFEDQGGVTWGQTSLSLSHTFHGGFLLDSCNGLLLYLAIDEERVTKDGEACTKFVVSNPVLNQCLEIPFHQRWHCLIFAALVFDGSQKHFKVIHYSTYRFSKVIKCYIFSSETMEWKEHEARVLNSSFSNDTRGCSDASLYWKGKLYSTWGKSMLVYNVEKGFFNLVSLPRIGQWHKEELLWEAEGQLHYCQSGFGGFHLWTYEDLNCKWLLKQSVTDDELKLKNCVLFLGDEEKIRFLKRLHYIHVVAFDDDLQILYLKISDAIFSYSLETRQLAKVMRSDPSSFDLSKFDNYSLIFKAYQFRQ